MFLSDGGVLRFLHPMCDVARVFVPDAFVTEAAGGVGHTVSAFPNLLC